MSKTLTTRQFAVLKRTAQNTYPLTARKARVEKQIAELQQELDVIDAQITGMEIGSRALTGGFNSLDLVERIVVGTGKFDVEGKEATVTKFVAKEGALRKNEEDNTYEILLGFPDKAADSSDSEPVEETTVESDAAGIGGSYEQSENNVNVENEEA